MVRSTGPTGAVTQDAYDAAGHKTVEVDGNGAVSTWAYDHFGELQTHTDIGGATYQYQYDAARQLTQQTNSRGQNLQYRYDEAGQLTQLTDASLGQVTAYAYDLAGNHLEEKTTQGGVVYQDNHLAYDALGRLRDVSDERVHISIDYDAAGNRTHIKSHVLGSNDQSQDQNSWYAYDAMNRQILVDGTQAAASGLSADQLAAAAGSYISASQGHIVRYDQNGNRIADLSIGNVVTWQAPVETGKDDYGQPMGRYVPLTTQQQTITTLIQRRHQVVKSRAALRMSFADTALCANTLAKLISAFDALIAEIDRQLKALLAADDALNTRARICAPFMASARWSVPHWPCA